MAHIRQSGQPTGPKESEVTSPFTTAAKGAARRRMKQTQLGMRTTMTLTQAAGKGREEEKRKVEQEKAEKVAAALALEAAEKEDAMEVEEAGLEGGGKEDEAMEQWGYDSDNSPVGIARNLDKEMVTPVGKKHRGGDLTHPTTATPKVTTALRRSCYKPHAHSYPRVIIEGSARLAQEDKIKEFTDLIGALLSNGKMVDGHFAIVPVIMGAGRRELREVKDIPANMTMLGGYVKILEKSLRVCRKNTPRSNMEGKSGRRDTYSNDMIYFTLAIACDVEPKDIISGISVE